MAGREHGTGLCVRRLMLEPTGTEGRQTARVRQSGIAKRPRPSGGARRRAGVHARSHGVIIGATLHNVLAFAGVNVHKGSCMRAMRMFVDFLEPTVAAVGRIHDTLDREVLSNGLACHRILRQQREHLFECRSARHAGGSGDGKRTWLDRKGLKDVAVGVTASVLAAHYIAAANGASAQDIATGVARCCASAEKALANWQLTDGAQRDVHRAALDVEARALGRARAACEAAVQRAAEHDLPRRAALQLQLEMMRQAAWPAGEECSAATHARLCERIQRGFPIGDGGGFAMPVTAVPLSAIPESVRLATGDALDDDASSAGSSYTATSDGSSRMGSPSSFGSGSEAGDSRPTSPSIAMDPVLSLLACRV